MITAEQYTIEATSISHFLDIVESMGGKSITLNAINRVFADCLVNDEPRRFWYVEAER